MENNAGVADKDLVRDAWESLGVAFVANESGMKHADPERTLVLTVREFQEQRKMLKLSLAWLKEYGELFHVERLKSHMHDLSAVELAWLGGIGSYMLEQGDARWKTIIQFSQSKLGTPAPLFPTSKLDELQSMRVGGDPHFIKFGLKIPVAHASEPKKIRPFSPSVRGNLWLRMRALFGTNWRADTATILVLGLAQNPYQAEQILGCAKETAYRNWKSLKDAEAESLLKGAAA